jgi:hypothetical protein
MLLEHVHPQQYNDLYVPWNEVPPSNVMKLSLDA